LALVGYFNGHIAGTRWATQVYQDVIEKDDNGMWRVVDPLCLPSGWKDFE